MSQRQIIFLFLSFYLFFMSPWREAGKWVDGLDGRLKLGQREVTFQYPLGF
jgi:hypothetical protein